MKEHRARIEWSADLILAGLPKFTNTVAPAWFWEDQPKSGHGWSLSCRFERPPHEQGNPTLAYVRFAIDSAPHQRLSVGSALRLFEPVTRNFAYVEILD